MYKKSIYNVYYENEKEELLIMNTRKERHIKLSKDIALKWNELQEDIMDETIMNSAWGRRLVEQEFLVDKEFDEAKWIEMKHNEEVFSNDLLSVTILPTNDCNFRCVYCYEEHKSFYMTDEIEENIIKFFKRKIPTVNKVRLNWFGGEPLLVKERVLRISKAVHEICKQHGVPLMGAMNTNGYLLDLETFKKLISYRVLYYEICIDGARETHNLHRPHYEQKNSFDVIIKNLLEIKQNVKTGTFKIALRTNITPKVEESLSEYIGFIKEYFRDDKRFAVYFQGVRNWGGDNIKDDMVPANETEYHKIWYEVASKNGLTSAEAFPLKPFTGYCDGARKNGYVLNYDGKIHKCTLAMFHPEYKEIECIGELDNKGEAHIDEDKLAKWIVKPKAVRETCKKCKLFPLCVDGTCVFQANIMKIHRCNRLEEVIYAQLKCMDNKNIIEYIGE